MVIKDEGVGVQPSEQQYLFEPFFTGFDTLHHSSGDYQFGKRGMGLGLCLVKTFVDSMEVGSRFKVLPTAARLSASACLVVSPSQSRPGQLTNSSRPRPKTHLWRSPDRRTEPVFMS